jgi:hypothetical protein
MAARHRGWLLAGWGQRGRPCSRLYEANHSRQQPPANEDLAKAPPYDFPCFPRPRPALQLVSGGHALLLDGGCEFHGYVSDVTRVWPVGGKFRCGDNPGRLCPSVGFAVAGARRRPRHGTGTTKAERRAQLAATHARRCHPFAPSPYGRGGLPQAPPFASLGRSGPQRAVYEAVLEVHRACLEACRPGATLRHLHQMSVRLLSEALVQVGLRRWCDCGGCHGAGVCASVCV